MTEARKVSALVLISVIAAAFFVTYLASSPARAEDCQYTYDNFGKAFVEKYCTRCHASANKGLARKGAPSKYNFDVVETIQSHKAEIIKKAVIKKSMPPSDPKPAADELTKLADWLNCEYK